MMAKTANKSKSKEKSKKPRKKSGKYIYAIGRRKRAVAQVRLFTNKGGKISINDAPYQSYFPTYDLQKDLTLPLKLTKTLNKFNISIKAKGSGIRGQAEAARLGIARALVSHNADFKKTLRGAGLLTRDPREKERKKPGLKKARRAPQWQKR